MKYRCLKQHVECILIKDGIEVSDFNGTLEKIEKCPRLDMKSGEGYDLCKRICNQQDHAEIAVIKKAKRLGINVIGATIKLKGHTYCCDNCKKYMNKEGIKEVIFV